MDDFIDDDSFDDDYDGENDFTDETPEEEHADEEPGEHEIEEIELNECDGFGWEEIAFLGAMAEQIAEERRIKEMLEKQSEEDEEKL